MILFIFVVIIVEFVNCQHELPSLQTVCEAFGVDPKCNCSSEFIQCDSRFIPLIIAINARSSVAPFTGYIV